MSHKTDSKEPGARCAICGGPAASIADGIRWDVCPACADGLPGKARADLLASRCAVTTWSRLLVGVLFASALAFSAVEVFAGHDFYIEAAIVAIMIPFAWKYDRVYRGLRDAVHVAALCAIPGNTASAIE
jgi:hypothetical protein